MNRQLEALERLYLSTVPTPDEVWRTQATYHVESLHPVVSRRLLAAMDAIGADHTPAAAVVQGEPGSGKTHLLGWVRQEIQSRGGYFFYIKLVANRDVWESTATSLVDNLYRRDDGGHEQLRLLINDLARRTRLDDTVRAALAGKHKLTRAHLDAFVSGIRGLDLQVGNEAGYAARALALVASLSPAAEAGVSYLALNDDELSQRTAWGLPSRARPAQLMVRDLTRLLALSGPLVFAFDQLDPLVAASTTTLGAPSSQEGRAAKRLTDEIATGLMNLREETRRTLMVVACQPNTWERIKSVALRSALDRFDLLPELGTIPDVATATALVSSRFRPVYESVQFEPPTPTSPISATALAEAPHRYTVRRLLGLVSQHIKTCLDTGTVMELTTLATTASKPAAAPPPHDDLDVLTERFENERRNADIAAPFAKETENRVLVRLLGDGLACLVKEIGGSETRFQIETDFGRNPALHVRFHVFPDENSEDAIHVSIRGIATESPIAAQNRITGAINESGLTAGLTSRRLILLRNTNYPSGSKTDQIKNDFLARGGESVPLVTDDIQTLTALSHLLAANPPGLTAWLRWHRPASQTELFAKLLAELGPYLDNPVPADDHVEVSTPPQSDVTIGITKRGQRPFNVELKQLRMHTAVIGAAGSGKTVLLKHLIEQCALQGVSAIVLDPNDDLGRLGDPWPSPPDGWTEDHEKQAQRYFDDTEVVVWTPGLNRGRPLTFHPLPAFGPVLGDADDFAHLLTSTVDTISPYAGIRGRSSRATKQRGMLRRVLDHYVREGGRTLAGFVELLGEPPSGTVNSRTGKLAVEMADTLEAEAETNPLFGESGTPADPGLLLTPSPGKASRISVISFIGLSGDAPAWFVSRLQAALFAWFKVHPAPDPLLGGLLVIDEAQNFVPSGSANPSTESTVELIRQVRKYGLGILLASQAPKGIHHQTVGNTANQFIGRLTAKAQLDAAKAMAQARNSNIDDLASLISGTFYAAGEGTTFSKIEVPICLSHHAGPLRENEVIERARRT